MLSDSGGDTLSLWISGYVHTQDIGDSLCNVTAYWGTKGLE
ncbi:MAG: hypothetical protein WBV62_14325 [Roseobacter sp.]